jgi:alcohol dehydrogenase class IV
MDFNYQEAPERYALIGEALGLDFRGVADPLRRKRLLDAVLDLRRACGIREGLGARGVQGSDLGGLARKAIQDPCNATNPRPPSTADLRAIYEEAL